MRGKNLKFWIVIFLTPALLMFLLFFGAPFVIVTVTSFFKWKLSTQVMTFTGFSNYIQLFTDEAYRKALTNTLIWIAIQSTVHVGIGTLVAIIISKRTFAWKLVRTVYMVPNIISMAAFAMIFLNIFNTDYGAVNTIIRMMGFKDFSLNWYFDSRSAFYTVTLSWVIYAPVVMMLIFAEIMSIDESIYESARVDGATSLQADMYITLPMLRNAIGSCVIIAGTSMLKEFEHIYLTTKGGPGVETMNLPLYLYNTAMKINNYSYANTIGVTIIAIGIIVVLFVNKAFKMGRSDI